VPLQCTLKERKSKKGVEMGKGGGRGGGLTCYHGGGKGGGGISYSPASSWCLYHSLPEGRFVLLVGGWGGLLRSSALQSGGFDAD